MAAFQRPMKTVAVMAHRLKPVCPGHPPTDAPPSSPPPFTSEGLAPALTLPQLLSCPHSLQAALELGGLFLPSVAECDCEWMSPLSSYSSPSSLSSHLDKPHFKWMSVLKSLGLFLHLLHSSILKHPRASRP